MQTQTRFQPAMPIIAAALGRVFEPPEPVTPSKWMADHLIVPDGPRAGGRWDPELTPYVAAIVDALGPDSPHNMVAVGAVRFRGIIYLTSTL